MEGEKINSNPKIFIEERGKMLKEKKCLIWIYIHRRGDRIMKKTRVLIADGSTFMRIMLATALERTDFEVVGEAKDGEEAIKKCRELKPDVMLVDVALDGKDGIEVTRTVVNDDPSVVVIMLISESINSPDVIVAAIRAGALGYIKKPLTAEEIQQSIRGALKRR